MHSTLFSLDLITIHSFGACLALALLACHAVLSYLVSKRGYSKDIASNLLVLMIISGIIGARIFYVIENWSFYSANLSHILKIQEGGLVFYGGFLLALLILVLTCRIQHFSIAEFLDFFAIVLPLGHAIGRVGCFLNGCCYGRVSSACIAVSFPQNSIPWTDHVNAHLIPTTALHSLPVLPSQLIETALNLAVFLFLLFRFHRPHPKGSLAYCYVILYALIRFSVEFTRADPRLQVGPLSIGQIISLALLAATLLFGILHRTRSHR